MSDTDDQHAQSPDAGATGVHDTTYAPAQPAGWYPDTSGAQRYWDGVTWTEHTAASAAVVQTGGYAYPQQPAVRAPMTPTDEKQSATLAHALGIFTWIGPLVIYLTQGDRSAFVKHHTSEALNFSITLFLASMVCFVLMFVLIGFILLPLVWLGGLIMHIMGAMAANRGEWYRYPISIRLVSGAQG